MSGPAPAPIRVVTGMDHGGPTWVQHSGWSADLGDGMLGPLYEPPTVDCVACSIAPMTVASVRVTGGRTSLIWRMECPECGHQHLYPATAYGEGQ